MDYVQVFPQASLDVGEEVCMHLLKYFHIDDSLDRKYYILQLRKIFYDLK